MEELFYLFSSCPMDSLHRMNLDGTMELKRSQREFLPAPHELEVTCLGCDALRMVQLFRVPVPTHPFGLLECFPKGCSSIPFGGTT